MTKKIAILLDIDGTLAGLYRDGKRELRSSAPEVVKTLSKLAPVFLWSSAGADNGHRLLSEFPVLKKFIQGCYAKADFPIQNFSTIYAIDDENCDPELNHCKLVTLEETYNGEKERDDLLKAAELIMRDIKKINNCTSKKLYILRHAQPASLENGQNDFNRLITEEGKKDTIKLGLELKTLKITPELIITSSAERTVITAKTIAESIDHDNEIVYLNELYLADIQQLANIVVSIDDSIDSALLVAHNPGLTDLVNYFTGTMHDNLSPCSFCSIEFSVASWRDIKSGKVTFTWSPEKSQRSDTSCQVKSNIS